MINTHLFGNYYLTAPDVMEQTALSFNNDGGSNYGVIIKQTVPAVGFNEDYIIAMQGDYSHRPNGKWSIFPWKTQDNVVSNIRYYILPVKEEMDWRTMNGLMGPLTLEEFEEKRKELGISDMEFSVKIKGFVIEE